tara:strand:- start:3631 stop:4911 length:1281 start_codon:yes stop_codon:yes gene_type:complete
MAPPSPSNIAVVVLVTLILAFVGAIIIYSLYAKPECEACDVNPKYQCYPSGYQLGGGLSQPTCPDGNPNCKLFIEQNNGKEFIEHITSKSECEAYCNRVSACKSFLFRDTTEAGDPSNLGTKCALYNFSNEQCTDPPDSSLMPKPIKFDSDFGVDGQNGTYGPKGIQYLCDKIGADDPCAEGYQPSVFPVPANQEPAFFVPDDPTPPPALGAPGAYDPIEFGPKCCLSCFKPGTATPDDSGGQRIINGAQYNFNTVWNPNKEIVGIPPPDSQSLCSQGQEERDRYCELVNGPGWVNAVPPEREGDPPCLCVGATGWGQCTSLYGAAEASTIENSQADCCYRCAKTDSDSNVHVVAATVHSCDMTLECDSADSNCDSTNYGEFFCEYKHGPGYVPYSATGEKTCVCGLEVCYDPYDPAFTDSTDSTD